METPSRGSSRCLVPRGAGRLGGTVLGTSPSLSLPSRSVEDGLTYRFHAAWDEVLQVLEIFFESCGKQCHPVMRKVSLAGRLCGVSRPLRPLGHLLPCPRSACSRCVTCVSPRTSPTRLKWTRRWGPPWLPWAPRCCWKPCPCRSTARSERSPRQWETSLPLSQGLRAPRLLVSSPAASPRCWARALGLVLAAPRAPPDLCAPSPGRTWISPAAGCCPCCGTTCRARGSASSPATSCL